MTAFSYPPSTIHKFDLPLKGATLPLSPSAKVVLVAMQDGVIRLWARRIVDGQGRPSFSGDGRRFEVYGTGHPIPGRREYVGSVIDGEFVWHVVENVAEERI